MKIELVRRIPLKYKVAELWEFCFFNLGVSGQIATDTQMILNLKHIDRMLKDLSSHLETCSYPTLNGVFDEISRQLNHHLAIYGITLFTYEMDHIHSGLSYQSWEGRIYVKLTKYLRYKEEFGKGSVTLRFGDFQRLNDRERRQDMWILSEADSPCAALKAKFPQAVFYSFEHFMDQSILYWERLN